MPSPGFLLKAVMESEVQLPGLPAKDLYDDVVTKFVQDKDAYKLLTQMETAFIQEHLEAPTAAALFHAGLVFAKRYAKGDIPKQALVDFVTPLNGDLCEALGIKSAQNFLTDVKISKTATLKWFPEEAGKIFKVYCAMYRACIVTPHETF